MADSSDMENSMLSASDSESVGKPSYRKAALFVPYRMQQVMISWVFIVASIALILDFASLQALVRDIPKLPDQKLTWFDELCNWFGVLSCINWLSGFILLAHWVHSVGATSMGLFNCYMKLVASVLFNLQPMTGTMTDAMLGGSAGLWWSNLTGILFFHFGNLGGMSEGAFGTLSDGEATRMPRKPSGAAAARPTKTLAAGAPDASADHAGDLFVPRAFDGGTVIKDPGGPHSPHSVQDSGDADGGVSSAGCAAGEKVGAGALGGQHPVEAVSGRGGGVQAEMHRAEGACVMWLCRATPPSAGVLQRQPPAGGLQRAATESDAPVIACVCSPCGASTCDRHADGSCAGCDRQVQGIGKRGVEAPGDSGLGSDGDGCHQVCGFVFSMCSCGSVVIGIACVACACGGRRPLGAVAQGRDARGQAIGAEFDSLSGGVERGLSWARCGHQLLQKEGRALRGHHDERRFATGGAMGAAPLSGRGVPGKGHAVRRCRSDGPCGDQCGGQRCECERGTSGHAVVSSPLSSDSHRASLARWPGGKNGGDVRQWLLGLTLCR